MMTRFAGLAIFSAPSLRSDDPDMGREPADINGRKRRREPGGQCAFSRSVVRDSIVQAVAWIAASA
jgi:hypothetical protein